MSNLNAAQESLPKNVHVFQPATFQEADRNEKVQEESPEGLPTAVCNSAASLFELDGKQVAGSNRWMSFYTNVRYQAFGPLALTAVSTTLYQHPSVILLALSSLIS